MNNGNIILTQGFQQLNKAIHGIDLDALLFHEGPCNSGAMNTHLLLKGLIPLNQPFNVSPWKYEGQKQLQ